MTPHDRDPIKRGPTFGRNWSLPCFDADVLRASAGLIAPWGRVARMPAGLVDAEGRSLAAGFLRVYNMILRNLKTR